MALRQSLDLPKRQTLVDAIADALVQYIASEGLQPGDRLPSERQLVTMMDASRLPLREALCMLKGLGIVEARQGSGVFVGRMDFASIFEMLSPLLRAQAKIDMPHMMEVRLHLEPTVADLAARHRSDRNVTQLETCLAGMKRNLRDLAVFIQHDIAFHQELALATGNPIFQVFSASLTDLLREVQFAYPQHVSHRQASVDFHTRILDAVRTQDADVARDAMAEHMTYVGRQL